MMTYSSNMTKGAALTLLTLLSACGTPVSRPMPLSGSGPAAVDGAKPSYVIDSQSPRPGALLTVTRTPAPFGYSDGAEAKGVAVKFCANSNRRLSPDVFGHFVSPAWVFKEGCR